MVNHITRSWRIDTAWWRGEDEAAHHTDYEILTRAAPHCIIYHDRHADIWHLEQIID